MGDSRYTHFYLVKKADQHRGKNSVFPVKRHIASIRHGGDAREDEMRIAGGESFMPAKLRAAIIADHWRLTNEYMDGLIIVRNTENPGFFFEDDLDQKDFWEPVQRKGEEMKTKATNIFPLRKGYDAMAPVEVIEAVRLALPDWDGKNWIAIRHALELSGVDYRRLNGFSMFDIRMRFCLVSDEMKKEMKGSLLNG